MSQSTSNSLAKRLLNAVTMSFVLWVSLMLLVYVAIGESRRTYEQFLEDKLTGQVLVVKNSMEAFLRSGLPAKQFIGFNQLADQLLQADGNLHAVNVHDLKGQTIFERGAAAPLLPPSGDGMRTDAELYQVVVPLSDRFEQVAQLSISMPRAAVTAKVDMSFDPLVTGVLVPTALLFLGLLIFGPRLRVARFPWAQVGFVLAFLSISGWVVATLITLYSEGAQSKSRALADSLGHRLSDLVAYNLNIDEIDGLDKTFGKYLASNPDIDSAALVVDGKIAIHTDPTKAGRQWKRTDDTYQYTADLTPEGAYRKVFVAVELPTQIVANEILRSIKNFAALFIASAFLASLFFQVGGTMNRGDVVRTTEGPLSESESAWMLSFARPVFFLGVLVEHLTYVFLPQMVQDAATQAGVASSWVSAPFVGFYAFFALTLIPAGHLAQRIGAKHLMYSGLVLSGLGLGSLALDASHWSIAAGWLRETVGMDLGLGEAGGFWTIMAARCVSGIGQGMLFIGVQSYLLAAALPGKKTQAAAIIVYGFQGGMISGMAVGSLLVGSLGTYGVFQLAAAVAGAAAVYTLLFVPRIDMNRSHTPQPQSRNMLRNTLRALGNAEFINTMLTIGMPAKAILTGIITFALPLLLVQSGYAKEDIGQIIMVYALAVVLASRFIAPHVDKIGSARAVLFQGTILSGVGLGMAALAGIPTDAAGMASGGENVTLAMTVFLTVGVALVGIAHGFINAPVVTYIADSNLAASIGATTATATYRFLERVGHVAGPIIVGQLLLWVENPWHAVGFTAAAVVLLGLVFIGTSRAGPPAPSTSGPDRRTDESTQVASDGAEPAAT